MKYREIVAVTGLSGLYQLLTTKSDGAIVRNVADKSTKFISARQHNVTPLESIEVYTTGDNVRLQDVFQKMLDQEAAIPLADAKSADNATIKSYFKSIFPEFDEERVYVSDMKKMLRWYDLLKINDLLTFEKEEEGTEEEGTEEEGTEEGPEEEGATEEAAAGAAPVEHDTKAGNATAPAINDTQAEAPAAGEAVTENAPETIVAEADEKPKKAAKKKKAEAGEAAEGEEKPAKKTAKKKKTEE